MMTGAKTGMGDEPYLFDVGVTALAHAGTPVSESALSYVRRAIDGEIDAVVPYTSLFGAHHVLRNVYGFSNAEASALMQRFMDARRVHWYDDIGERATRTGFEIAGDANVGGWDGYYSQVALDEGVETVVTLDDGFDRVDGVSVEVALSSEEFAELSDYLGV